MKSERVLAGAVLVLGGGLISGGAVWATAWATATTPAEVRTIVIEDSTHVMELRRGDLAIFAEWKTDQKRQFESLQGSVNAIENQQIRKNDLLDEIHKYLRNGR